MGSSSGQMRLTVDVLPLAEENSYGPYRDVALETFKGRKFALPVNINDTFEQVWKQIEERYKRNYLTPAQAATFTIKVLQDAYDCDLDLGDTVSSIFAGESDPTRRMIKVVPSFIYRDFSVPLTSNLRPASARKRQREANIQSAHKRRRIDGDESPSGHIEDGHDRPIPSTESESGDTRIAGSGTDNVQRSGLARRSTSSSVVHMGVEKTGRAEFGCIKEESPELGLSTARTIPESEDVAQDDQAEEDRPLTHTVADELQDHDITRSPLSPSPEGPVAVRNQPVKPRRDIFDVASSPEFMRPSPKNAKVYSVTRKIPQRKTTNDQNATRAPPDTPNGDDEGRGAGKLRQSTRSARSRAFQFPQVEEITSTPDVTGPADSSGGNPENLDQQDRALNVAQSTPDALTIDAQNGAPGSAKSSGLKKPSRKSFVMPPPSKGLVSPKASHERSRSNTVRLSIGRSPSSRVSSTPTESSKSKLERIKKNIAGRASITGGTPDPSQPRGLEGSSATSPRLGQDQESGSQGLRLPSQGVSPRPSADPFGSASNLQTTSTPSTGRLPTPQENDVASGAMAIEVSTNSNSTSQLPKATPSRVLKRTPVPIPGQDRNSSQNSNTPSNGKPGAVKRQPRRSEIPLPPNVRARYSSEALSTPPQAQSNPTKKDTPVFATPTLSARDPKKLNMLADSAGADSTVGVPSQTSKTPASAGDDSGIEGSPHDQDSGNQQSPEQSSRTEVPEQGGKTLPSDDQPVARVNNTRKPRGDKGRRKDNEVHDSVPPGSDKPAPADERASPVGTGVTEERSAPENHNESAAWATPSWDFDTLKDLPDGAANRDDPVISKTNGRLASPSPSASGGSDVEDNSTRSSPTALRQPARFLSRSPTPQESSAEDENEASPEPSPEPDKAATAAAGTANKEASDISTDSESSEEEEEEEDDDEDIEMDNTVDDPPSSLPTLPSPPPPKFSTQPAPSRPIRKTEVPLPGSKTALSITSKSVTPLPSSQPLSQPSRRPRSSQYATLKEQLSAVRSGPSTAQKAKAFDPSSQSLGALKKAKQAGKKGAAAIIADDSSDDDSSSSSSDDD